MKKLFALLLSAFLLLAGCSGSDEAVTNTAADFDSMSSTSTKGFVESAMPGDSQIITNSMSVRVDIVSDSAKAVENLVIQYRGRIDSKSENREPTNNDISFISYTLRIPTDGYEGAVEDLKSFGDLENYSSSASDVTLQAVDLASRISALTDSITKLEELMTSATNVSDLLAAEGAITQRKAELDSLVSQQKYLTDQVEMTTIWLTLAPKSALDAVKPIGFLAGLEKGWESIVDFLSNLTTWSGLALPWIGFLVALILMLSLIKRLKVKKN
jgi:hypothetical protein